jgi:hypothetical protein
MPDGSVRTLVQGVRDALPDSHEWDERELAQFALAERLAADIDLLEADIAECGARVEARGGQQTLNQAFGEARQARVGAQSRAERDRHSRIGEPREPARVAGGSGALEWAAAACASAGGELAMARLRTGRHRSTLGYYSLDLTIGPVRGGASVEDLELSWEVYGPTLMARDGYRIAGRRPWAWWTFERGEQPPRWTRVDGMSDRAAEGSG